ncbi:MAG: hypothetical protein HY422_03170 [Candidatus Komeilibacteria bacterium]|nr:hypothetical protein [Candidatus Komeilibacteria bacterium]
MHNFGGTQHRGVEQHRTRQRVRGIRWEWYAVVFVMVFCAGILVRAQTFGVPSAPAPNNTTALNTLSDTGDFVSLTSVAAELVKSSLVVALSTPSSAIIGDFERNVSLSGFAGITTDPFTPPALPGTVPGAAVYGYAKGTGSSVGLYGYTPSGTGVFGATVLSGGYAARFLGPVSILSKAGLSGSLYVQGTMSVPTLTVVSTGGTVEALESGNGMLIDGKLLRGIDGQSSGEYGVYGESLTNGIGFSSLNNGVTLAGAQTIKGAVGTTLNTTGAAGVFGWSLLGNGVYGNSGAASDRWAVEGKATVSQCSSTDPKVCSAGVYGRGGAYAGYFEGDLNIDNGGDQNGAALYLGSSGITEAGLKALLDWCDNTAGVGDKCPDPH